MSENPWKNLVKTEDIYCAEDDKEFIEKSIEETWYTNLEKDAKLVLNIVPQHFIGNIEKSKVLILSLNPGVSDEYLKVYEEDKKLEKAIKETLTLDKPKFYAFDFDKEGSQGYWSNKLLPLINEKKFKQKLSSDKRSKNESKSTEGADDYLTGIFSIIDFFPYHSKKFAQKYTKLANGNYLPSQKFVFEIVKKRVNNPADNVIIILSRSFRKWYEAIPDLVNYEKCYEVSNPQNPSFKHHCIKKVTREEVGKQVYDEINDKY